MGGFGGLTWDEYRSTPDHVIRDSYFAERDDDHNLVTYRQRRRRLQEGKTETGRPEMAGRELPSHKDLRIPDEAKAVNPMISRTPFGMSYMLMWWQVWRKRQQEGAVTENGEPITDAYILARWKAKAGQGVRKNG